MKNYLQLFVLALALALTTACSKKDKTEETTEPIDTAETTTTTTTTDEGSSVTIEVDKKGGEVKVESADGTDVKVDVDKKGGSVEVKDDNNKVDVKVKDDDKK